MHYTQEDGSSLLSALPTSQNMVSGLKLAFYTTTTWDQFLFNIIVNFEKYEI